MICLIPSCQVHDFAHGCAAQYKSRHCAGDRPCFLAEFGYVIQRSVLKHLTQKENSINQESKGHMQCTCKTFTLPATSLFPQGQSLLTSNKDPFSLLMVLLKGTDQEIINGG